MITFNLFPIAVITDASRSKILAVKKKDSSVSRFSPEKNKLLLYIGGHIRLEDKSSNNPFDTFRRCLQREIEEEIGESLTLKKNKPDFLIYDMENPKSKKHLAVCYVITLDLENKTFSPTAEEFILKKGKSKSGRILKLNELRNLIPEMESWSKYILMQEFDTDIQKELNLFNYLKS